MLIIIVIGISLKSQLNLKEERRRKREKRGRGPAYRLDGSLDRTGSDLAPGSLWAAAVGGGPPEEAALAPNKERGGGKEPEDVFRGRVTCWPGAAPKGLPGKPRMLLLPLQAPALGKSGKAATDSPEECGEALRRVCAPSWGRAG